MGQNLRQMNWSTTEQADADLICGREWIEADNPTAAQALLATASECFDRLCQFPQMGAPVKSRSKKLAGLRFMVLSPPYNRWIVFYRVGKQIQIVRVLYGGCNWRRTPELFS